jgi:hypothetical protein
VKNFLTIILGLACLVLLFFGNLHWQKKIDRVGSSSIESVSAKEIKTNHSVEEVSEDNQSTIFQYASNWSEQEVQKLQAAIADNRPYRILLAGSPSLGEGENSWPALFKEEMLHTYGENIISIETKIYTETTEEFVDNRKQNDFIEGNYDLIIWEPFTLTDNGNVVVETSHEYIMSVINEMKSTNSQTSFMLQPPNPFYQPRYYSVQVQALKELSEENQIHYLDHWSNWPDTSSEEILDYLIEDEKAPNEEGHRVWADFLLSQFISE